VEPPNLVRVVAAFVAGVVIALGSALIYVRVSEVVHPQPMAQAQTATEAPPAGRVSEAPSTPAADNQDRAARVSVQPPEIPPLKRTQTPTQIQTPKPIQTARTRPATQRGMTVAAPRKQQPKIARAQMAGNRTPGTEPVTDTTPLNNPAPVEPPPPPDIPAQPPDADIPAQPAPQPHVITLDAGTTIPIRLTEALSTDRNYTGDTFRGTLEAPIISNGFIIADRGSKVLGRVVNSEKGGRIEGTADLNLTLTEINTTDGQRVHVETGSWDRRGPTSTGEDAAKIAGGAGLGAIIGAAAGGGKGAAIGAGIGGAAGTGAVLLTRGKAATAPVETRLTFRLATALTITEKIN